MKPVLYMDIDGVILDKQGNLAIGAIDFIKYATDNFEIYWLTTHCKQGDANHAVEYVQRSTNYNLRPYLEKFRPTTWSQAKTEAINFNKPFLWFDDNLFIDERNELLIHNVLENWIEVNLRKDPESLSKFLQSFPLPVDRLDWQEK